MESDRLQRLGYQSRWATVLLSLGVPDVRITHTPVGRATSVTRPPSVALPAASAGLRESRS